MPQGSTKENIVQQLSKELSTAHILKKIFQDCVFFFKKKEKGKVFLKTKLEDEIYSLVNIFIKREQ